MFDTKRFRLPFLNKPPVVPVVRLEGAISATPGRFGKSLNLTGVEKALEKAFATKSARAVALLVNSPGGAPVQSNLIHQRIRQLAVEHDRRVLVFCEDVAASGGYWIALAGDEIYADPGSIVGSIGVIAASFGFTGLMDKAGVERRMYTAGQRKAMLDPFSPEDPDDVARLKALQSGLHEQFIAKVKECRGGKLKGGEDELFSGDVWLGRTAKELGLIDDLGSPLEVLRAKFGPDVKLKPFGGPKKSLLAKLVSGGAEAALGTVEHRALWARYGL